MRIFSLVCLLMLTGCGSLADEIPLATPNIVQVVELETATPTETPTPTIGYQYTADAAQTAEVDARETARAANIVVAQFTADQDSRNHVQASWTVTAELIEYQREGMTQQASVYTATAYATSFPATQRAQALINSARSTEVGMTINAPTQIYALAQSETLAKYSDTIQVTELVVQGAASALMLSLAVAIVYFIGTARRRADPVVDLPMGFAPVEPISAERQTILHIRTDTGGGFSRTERTAIPGTRDQFSALVAGVLSGQSLAYNVWEGAERPFTRDQFTQIRNWLLSNRLAQSAGQGALILSAAGESMFIAWQESQQLPDGYKFEETNYV